MQWLDGKPLLSHLDHSLEDRNRIATAMFRAWWYPFAHYGVIHGDPHLGNYTVFDEAPKGRGQRDRGSGRDQSPRLRLHPHLPAGFRPGRDRPL